ncbi:hypothetical protein BC952_2392 [Flavobacterium limicola]|uniref:GLPGLI family protein n=2 Tax=Flavobacterium limicola TaxID=180441 RepID=A0A495RY49_9FLAO|nr:hypothetical protein BC952_2392 [Flavobacterium limicola]
MKQLLTLLLTISTSFLFSQKKYEFDYLIEFKQTYYKNSKSENTISGFYLTNSKKNNYVALVTSLDSTNYKMHFKDENGLSFNVNFKKSDLEKAEFINVNCYYVSNYNNPYKVRIEEYDFFNLNDTIIDETEYSRYKLTSTIPRREKKKKLGTEFYIIDNNTKFHLPLLYFSTAYEEWKSKKNIPNGIFKERHLVDYYGKLFIREKTIGYRKINKTIIIDEECDYTRNK